MYKVKEAAAKECVCIGPDMASKPRIERDEPEVLGEEAPVWRMPPSV
jgi:hypothetical protein